MTYIDYINCFWHLNDIQVFSLAETKLYFFLLSQANKNMWQQPFRCSNQQILAALSITKPTLISARQHLVEREIISFTPGGKGQHSPCTYTIRVKVRVKEIYPNLDPKLYPKQEKEKIPPLTPLIKEKEINKEKEREKEPLAQGITILSDPSLAPLIPLEDIMANIRLTQQQWVERFCMNNQINPTAFNIWTDLFIRDLESRNIKSKSIPDFTDHFAKWFLYQKDKKNGNKQHSRQEQRQQDEILTATALSDRIAELDADYLRRSQAAGSGTHQDVPQTLRTDSDIQPDCGDYPFR